MNVQCVSKSGEGRGAQRKNEHMEIIWNGQMVGWVSGDWAKAVKLSAEAVMRGGYDGDYDTCLQK